MPYLCPRGTPTPPEALCCSSEPQLTTIRHPGGVGVALGAQTGHMIAYFASSEGFLMDTVFSKKCQKRSKGGTPLFGPHFGNLAPYQVPPTSDWALGGRFPPPRIHSPGGKPHFEENFWGGGPSRALGYETPSF